MGIEVPARSYRGKAVPKVLHIFSKYREIELTTIPSPKWLTTQQLDWLLSFLLDWIVRGWGKLRARALTTVFEVSSVDSTYSTTKSKAATKTA